MHDLYRLKIDISSLSCDPTTIPILDGSVPIPRDCTDIHPLSNQFVELVLRFEC